MSKAIYDDDGRTLTLHPQGKTGVRLPRHRYEPVRTAILEILPKRGPGPTFTDLAELIAPKLKGTDFPADASVMWHCVSVKLDLEARGLIHRVPGTRPEELLRGPAPE
ncbi:MAG: hypothetical protein AB8G96_04240 [Phycisphaerales bacterium]